MTQPGKSWKKMRGVKLAFLLAMGLCVAAACTPYDAPPTTAVPSATPAPVFAINGDYRFTGAALYSDSEFEALKLQVASLDDIDHLPASSVKLALGTRVTVLGNDSVAIGVSDGTKVRMLQWPFRHVHVVSGPASGRDGWILGVRPLGDLPVLVEAR